MAPALFVRAVLPALVAEFVLFAVVWAVPVSDHATLAAFSLLSWVVLPLLVGFRVSRARGVRVFACLGAIAISGVTLLCAMVMQFFTSPDWLAFGGLAFATLLIAVPLQVIFGLLGTWVATHRIRHEA